MILRNTVQHSLIPAIFIKPRRKSSNLLPRSFNIIHAVRMAGVKNLFVKPDTTEIS